MQFLQHERSVNAIKIELPIACSHSVFTKEQRTAYKRIWEALETRRIRISELENGLQHQFPGDAETLRLVNEWVSMERICCPFLTFSVIASHEEKPVLLQLTGNEEVKSFLKESIQASIASITSGLDR